MKTQQKIHLIYLSASWLNFLIALHYRVLSIQLKMIIQLKFFQNIIIIH